MLITQQNSLSFSLTAQHKQVTHAHIYKFLSGCEEVEQDAQLSQRDRAAGYISFGRTWKTGTGGPIQ